SRRFTGDIPPAAPEPPRNRAGTAPGRRGGHRPRLPIFCRDQTTRLFETHNYAAGCPIHVESRIAPGGGNSPTRRTARRDLLGIQRRGAADVDGQRISGAPWVINRSGGSTPSR